MLLHVPGPPRLDLFYFSTFRLLGRLKCLKVHGEFVISSLRQFPGLISKTKLWSGEESNFHWRTGTQAAVKSNTKHLNFEFFPLTHSAERCPCSEGGGRFREWENSNNLNLILKYKKRNQNKCLEIPFSDPNQPSSFKVWHPPPFTNRKRHDSSKVRTFFFKFPAKRFSETAQRGATEKAKNWIRRRIE